MNLTVAAIVFVIVVALQALEREQIERRRLARAQSEEQDVSPL